MANNNLYEEYEANAVELETLSILRELEFDVLSGMYDSLAKGGAL